MFVDCRFIVTLISVFNFKYNYFYCGDIEGNYSLTFCTVFGTWFALNVSCPLCNLRVYYILDVYFIYLINVWLCYFGVFNFPNQMSHHSILSSIGNSASQKQFTCHTLLNCRISVCHHLSSQVRILRVGSVVWFVVVWCCLDLTLWFALSLLCAVLLLGAAFPSSYPSVFCNLGLHTKFPGWTDCGLSIHRLFGIKLLLHQFSCK